MDKRSVTKLFSHRCLKNGHNGQNKLEESGEDSGTCSDSEQRSSIREDDVTSDFSETELEMTYAHPDSFFRFHLSEKSLGGNDKMRTGCQDIDIETFAGRKCVGMDFSTIKSSRGSIRGVKNRVRAGIATFLEMKDSKSWQEREAGKVVVYTTTMGVIRDTFQRCLKVRHILRTHLIKYTEKDVFMSREIQNEIRERMGITTVELPQVFIEGRHLGDADTIEKLNETGELRKILQPYKNSEVCITCSICGGYQLLPCSMCNGSKKSVYRNHFNSELIALKCMNCDEVGLVRCYAC
ncbi:glutaredoxin domain-containing cysteine-rich protein CG31559 isoform X2 [Halyomorpha halys]|uniref:glutaredoxin domain-containing cysteine-rich protein CG31559 isoform X2 n=1 Tax=Halyomorpha halys TaxID=286706 RepID=UPI0006D4EE0D|nr:glutaredoxin domain-containing cysteine-rich protein CG31559-like isoform X2 [Halyomorpha halys]